MNVINKLFSSLRREVVKPMHKSFLLVEPFEGELIIEGESDNSSDLYRRLDLSTTQMVMTREEYECTNLKEYEY